MTELLPYRKVRFQFVATAAFTEAPAIIAHLEQELARFGTVAKLFKQDPSPRGGLGFIAELEPFGSAADCVATLKAEVPTGWDELTWQWTEHGSRLLHPSFHRVVIQADDVPTFPLFAPRQEVRVLSSAEASNEPLIGSKAAVEYVNYSYPDQAWRYSLWADGWPDLTDFFEDELELVVPPLHPFRRVTVRAEAEVSAEQAPGIAAQLERELSRFGTVLGRKHDDAASWGSIEFEIELEPPAQAVYCMEAMRKAAPGEWYEDGQGGYTWTKSPEGELFLHPSLDSAEVYPNEAPTLPRFAVGDRVRIVGTTWKDKESDIGMEKVVRAVLYTWVSEAWLYSVAVPGARGWEQHFEHTLQPATTPPAGPPAQ